MKTIKCLKIETRTLVLAIARMNRKRTHRNELRSSTETNLIKQSFKSKNTFPSTNRQVFNQTFMIKHLLNNPKCNYDSNNPKRIRPELMGRIDVNQKDSFSASSVLRRRQELRMKKAVFEYD